MDIKEQLTKALQSAIESIFPSTLKVTVEVVGEDIKSDPATHILFCSKLSGIPNGFLTMAVTKEDFCKMASKILEKDITEFSNESNNAFGEFVKSIAEEMKKQLADTPYDFTVAFPQILTDEEFKMFATAEATSLTKAFKTDFCEFGIIFLYRDASQAESSGDATPEAPADQSKESETPPEAEAPASDEVKEEQEPTQAQETTEEKGQEEAKTEAPGETPASEPATEEPPKEEAPPAETEPASPDSSSEEKKEGFEGSPKVILEEVEKAQEESASEAPAAETPSSPAEEEKVSEEVPPVESETDPKDVPPTFAMSESMQKLDEIIKKFKEKS